MEDKTFQKAFNAGYMLEKYVPALSQLLAKSLKNSTTTFSEGFLAGSQQYTEEKNHKDMIVSLFKNPGFQTPGKTIEEPDKDEPDMDR